MPKICYIDVKNMNHKKVQKCPKLYAYRTIIEIVHRLSLHCTSLCDVADDLCYLLTCRFEMNKSVVN